MTAYIKSTRVLVNDYRRKEIFLLSMKPLNVLGQNNSGSLKLLFDFYYKRDKPARSKNNLLILKVTFMVTWLCSTIVTEVEL